MKIHFMVCTSVYPVNEMFMILYFGFPPYFVWSTTIYIYIFSRYEMATRVTPLS
jgi:hypothetical protein